MPRIIRPSESWSSIAICSAARMGSCHGSTTTIDPKPTRRVLAAIQLRNCTTSGHIV